MIRITGAALTLLALAPAVGALDDGKPNAPTPAERVKALEREYKDAQDAYRKALDAAETKADKQKVFEAKYPQPGKYAERFLQVTEEHPKDPAALDALTWVVAN